MKTFSIILLFLFFSLAVEADSVIGKIVKVSSGDIVTLQDMNNKKYNIKLADINAPQNNQIYEKKAKEYLSSLISRKKVKVEFTEKDQDQRIIGTIYYKGKSINEQMVKDGYARRSDDSNSQKLLDLQSEAEDGKKGLWQGNDIIAPWQSQRQEQPLVEENNE